MVGPILAPQRPFESELHLQFSCGYGLPHFPASNPLPQMGLFTRKNTASDAAACAQRQPLHSVITNFLLVPDLLFADPPPQ
jgi:hypothetical protein